MSKQRFFAAIDMEEIVCLGEHDDYQSAFDSADELPGVVWVWPEDCLRKFIDTALQAVQFQGTPPPDPEPALHYARIKS